MVRIIADTTSSILPETATQLGIDFLPQIIIFGNDSFRDDSEIELCHISGEAQIIPNAAENSRTAAGII